MAVDSGANAVAVMASNPVSKATPWAGQTARPLRRSRRSAEVLSFHGLIWAANSIRDEPKVAGRSDAVYLLALIADPEVITVSAVSIRNLDDQVKERLRVRAARHGRSMEAEMRAILTDAVREPGEDTGLFQVLLERVSQLGGIELDIPARVVQPRAADLG